MRTGVAHWETLLRCRAIETQCFVVAAAQAGQHNEKRTSYGHALIVDPWGTIVAEGKGVGVEEEGTGIREWRCVELCGELWRKCRGKR